MNKKDLKKILAVGAVGIAAAATAAIIISRYRRSSAYDKASRSVNPATNAYILGGGMSALASALYLIRDCGFKAENVHIFIDKSYDHGNAEDGYICRRSKILDEKNSKSFFDLMREVYSLDIADLTVCDEILNLYNAGMGMRRITFISENGDVTDISNIRLSKNHRRAILSLLGEKKEKLTSTSIRELLPDDFFDTEFWKLVCATYGFSENCGAYEFINAIACMDSTLSGTLPGAYDRYEEIIEPLKAHLKKLGADVCEGASVTDVDIENGAADAVHYTENGVRKSVYLNSGDFCIMPTDEIADCESFGSFNESAPKDFSTPYRLWESLAQKHPSFKNPSALFDDGDENMSQEFTVTLSNHLLPELIDSVTAGALSSGGVLVLDNSNWKMTICSVPATHFKDGDDETAILWGTASRFDRDGAESGKPMTACSGAEILYELISSLNLKDAWEDIYATVVNVIPCHRRCDKAYLAPVQSKLEIIPTGISNFAVSGEFAEGSGSVFTEEFPVETAKAATYKLAKNKKKIQFSQTKSSAGVKRVIRRGF